MPSVRNAQAASVQGRDPARPGGIDAPLEQRGDREGEGHREADVAQVEHRRMDGHARVLQQRVQVAAVERRRQQARERVGGEQQEGEEADADQAHARRARARCSVAGRLSPKPATARVHSARISTHSSSEPSWLPQTRGEPVEQRQRRVRIARRRTATEKSLATKAAGRGSRRRARPARAAACARRPRERHPGRASPRCAPTSGSTACDAATQQREQQGELAEFGEHAFDDAWPHRLGRHRDVVLLPMRAAPASARRRLPAACSSRRAWPALRSRRNAVAAKRALAPPRPGLRGTGRAGCRV